MIKNIIFDIGNVLYTYDRDYLLKNYYQGEDFEFLKKEIFRDWEKMDEGILTPIEHLNFVKKNIPKKYHTITENVLFNWHKFVKSTGIILDVIKELKKKGYKLYILSNMTKIFIENIDYFPIIKDFDGAVYSCEVKMVKPNKDIYLYLLNKYSLKADECAFIDDNKQNIDTAKSLGINSFCYDESYYKLDEFLKSL